MTDQDNEAGQAADNDPAPGERPTEKFTGTGGLSVSVWRKKKPGESRYPSYSVKLERTWRDDTGQFHTSDSIFASDALRAAKLFEQADAWIEQDKGKGIGAMASKSR